MLREEESLRVDPSQLLGMTGHGANLDQPQARLDGSQLCPQAGTPAPLFGPDRRDARPPTTGPTLNNTVGCQSLAGVGDDGRLFVAHFAANQLAGIVVVLNDVDVAALLRVALDDRELAFSELLDGFRLSVEIVIADLAG